MDGIKARFGKAALVALAASVAATSLTGEARTRSRKAAAPAAFSATWSQKAPLPEPRAEVGAAEVGGKVYVVGGQVQPANAPPSWASTTTLMYDPATDRWSTRAPMPEALSHPGVASMGGKLYVVGGFTNIIHMGPRAVALSYDPATDSWTRLPDISSARGSVALAAVNGKLHAFGGREERDVRTIPASPNMPELKYAFGTVSFHQVFDPATGKWTDAPALPAPARDHMGVAVLNGRIHLFGGRVADVVDNLVAHDVFDTRTGKWSKAAPLPRPRSAGAFTVLDGRIIYAGGECKPGGQPGSPEVFGDVTAYDPGTDRWTALPDLPSPRHAFGAATVARTGYFAAGALTCGGGFSADLWALTPKRR